jgi:hypothetical protein
MQTDENQNTILEPTNSVVPEAQISEQVANTPVSPITDPVLPSKSHKKTIIAIVLVIVIILAGGGVFALYHSKHDTKTPVAKTSTVTSTKPSVVTRTASVLLTYVNENKSKDLIVSDSQQKILATLTLPTGKNTFSVLANNGKSVLVEEAYITGGPDANSVYYLVSSNGQSIQLPQSVAAVLHTITTGGAFLGNGNDYLYVSCNTTSCKLSDLNLATAAISTLYSQPQSKPSTFFNSVTLEAVSPQNIAYMTVDTANDGIASSLVKLDIATSKVTQSFSLPTDTGVGGAVGTISPDYSKLVYVNNDYYPVIVNLNTGTVVTVKTKDLTPFAWSPDSTKLAAVNTSGAVATASGQPLPVQPLALSYIDTVKGQAVSLKSFGARSANNVTIDGWSSASKLNYTYSQTSTPNDFSGSPLNDFAINVSTSTVTANPTPTGYRLVTANSF